MIQQILLVGLGGGLGSIARFGCQRWVSYHYPHAFPWATFAVNIIGCLFIGIFWGLSFKSFTSNENWKLFLMTGLCGGFTTFSAFTLEGIGLIREQKLFTFFSYVILSVTLGLLATYLGMRITK